MRPALALVAYAALLASELIGLRWQNLSLETGTLHIPEALTVGEVVLPKSGRQRAVP